jgi:hypothetical protein
MNDSKPATEPGQPKGTTHRLWSGHRGELRAVPATYSHTVRAAADDAVRVFLAHERNSPDAAAAVRQLVAGLGEQYGPQFVQDVAAKLLIELAAATAAITTEDDHEEIHAQAPS